MPRWPGLAWVALSVLGSLCAGCASHRPILYPNPHLQEVGVASADADIAACEEAAKAAGAESDHGRGGELAGRTAAGATVGAASGAVGGTVAGAIQGHTGRGAGIGAAAGAAGGATSGLLRGLFFGTSKPNPGYRNYVDRCLREKGYEVVGWR